MRIKMLTTFLLISLILWIPLVLRGYGETSGGSNFKCIQTEKEALLRFKRSLTIDPSIGLSLLSSWKGDDCCIWEGVSCDNTTGYVVQLDLSFLYAVSNKLDSALLDLKHLVYLDLTGIDFQGSQIPDFIGFMKQLQHLDLSGSYFGGLVPHQLSNLTSLSFLGLGENGFFGVGDNSFLPADNLNWLTSLSDLQYLDLSGMNLSKVDDLIHVLNRLPSLSELYLKFCGLGITQFFGVQVNSTMSSSLQYLDLGGNSFGDLVPKVLLNFSSLSDLHLSGNSFGGFVPLWLAEFKSLEQLDLNENHFSRFEGGIWRFIRSARVLRELYLSWNYFSNDMLDLHSNSSKSTRHQLEKLELAYNQFTGQIPAAALAQLSGLQMLDLSDNKIYGTIPPFPPSLQYIDLSNNNIHGSIPNLPFNLSLINLSHNQITGPMPHLLLQGSKLSHMDLSHNLISGPIPKSLCKLNSLNSLFLQGNRLSGIIPNCWNSSPELVIIVLSSNKLSGSIPSFSQLASLVLLKLSNNTLQGEIPSLANCQSLQILDLGQNRLFGSIPSSELYGFRELRILSLRENNLEGQLPLALCSLQSLRVLDLAGNNLTGVIPPCLGNLTSMVSSFEDHGISDSELSVTIVTKGEVLTYTSTVDFLRCMDLSANSIAGTIPEELVKLSGLVGLNLSYNQLRGSIPDKIGEMRSLESLDLSNNNLSGTIPESMSALTSLSHLNLSYNNLQGEIPTGRQLQTLNDPSTYAGNPSLCGDPLPKKCKEADDHNKTPTGMITEEEEKEHDYETMWFYLVITAGYAVGFWGVVGTLIIKRSWRHVYFKLAEDLLDWTHFQLAAWRNLIKEKIGNGNACG